MAQFRISRRVLHRRFLSIMPRIQLHAKFYFRHVKCWHTKEDRIQEAIDLAWKWFVGLARRGKDARRFPTRLADFAVRAVKSGRRLCGQLKSKDALSEPAQMKHGFYVGKLPDFSTETANPLTEALIDNTRTEVPEQVAFRCDFPSWVSGRSDRDRALVTDMALGHRTKDLAQRYHMSEGRVSQLRREFKTDWKRFTGDATVEIA